MPRREPKKVENHWPKVYDYINTALAEILQHLITYLVVKINRKCDEVWCLWCEFAGDHRAQERGARGQDRHLRHGLQCRRNHLLSGNKNWRSQIWRNWVCLMFRHKILGFFCKNFYFSRFSFSQSGIRTFITFEWKVTFPPYQTHSHLYKRLSFWQCLDIAGFRKQTIFQMQKSVVTSVVLFWFAVIYSTLQHVSLRNFLETSQELCSNNFLKILYLHTSIEALGTTKKSQQNSNLSIWDEISSHKKDLSAKKTPVFLKKHKLLH